MPKPLTVCNERGCTVLTRTSYCVGHSRDKEQERGSAASRGYDYKWQQYSKRYLIDYPICAHCNGESRVVDHIVPINQGGSMWDEKNHAPMCVSCHNRKTAGERSG